MARLSLLARLIYSLLMLARLLLKSSSVSLAEPRKQICNLSHLILTMSEEDQKSLTTVTEVAEALISQGIMSEEQSGIVLDYIANF